ITPQAVTVHVKSKGLLKGTIFAEHLADHHDQANLMISLLRPGFELDKLLVIDIEGNNLALSSKYSLIKFAEELPSDLSQLQPNSVVHGYVCNLIENGCFVRFLGRLTGFAPRSKAIDEPRAGLSESFFVGQSVRANIVDVNQEKSRVTLSLKQSSCASVDASFVQEYFLTDEKISNLQSSDTTESECRWVEKFSIGSLIKGTVQDKNDLGLVVNFDNINNVLGFIPKYHLGGTSLENGSVVQALVLDISRAERLVDLSLRPELINSSAKEVSNSQSKKKRKRGISKELKVHQRVSAVVEIVKEQYLILSIPEHNYTIGYAAVSDYNTQKLPVKQFSTGQSVVASVEALQTPLTSGRLLLLLDSVSGSSETSSKRAKKKANCEVGSVVQAEITEIKPFEVRLLDEMIKKFKQSCKVWLRKIQSYLKQDEENIQSVVNRALLCLPRHKHIKFISQTAILEFKCGVADRGRSLFEGVLREYPKRTDLWSVYLDQEIRLGEVDVIRSLFERAISLSLPPKKMKFLFKKFLEYEKSAGDEERVEYVKQRAMEYADSTLA
ncbi:hypothetical protein BRARA_A03376, partial [Brassica rapa]